MSSNIVWRVPRTVSLLPLDFDDGAYDAIVATTRRQGFLDALACDLVPSRQDHGNAYDSHVAATVRERERAAREEEWRQGKAERDAAREREVNLLRQRIADEQWGAEDARRRVQQLVAVERDRAFILLASGRVRNRPVVANGSLTCPSCGLADQPMMLPPPSYDNSTGRFVHHCQRCRTGYHLKSKQLAEEVRQLCALAAMTLAA
jgi:hypothetical protein